ncbi:HK97 gp10 family phage protein [Ferrovum sp.]|uniref:HK97 gp10 family phage protein n=1 Tax=Ferrovum sp. TaxID=2609467 RepID=UPI0026071E26|nr:HK97 gp10 family phage protein [Ferrovum sp.]
MSFQEEDNGIAQVKLMLRRLGALPSVLDEKMQSLAAEVAEKAKDMAPKEYGDLRDAIQVRRTAAARGADGRFISSSPGSNYEVYINNDHPSSRPDVKNVGQYAWFVYQYMGYGNTEGAIMVHGKPFMPSAESVALGAEKGVEVGGRFLERAAEAMRTHVHESLTKIVNKYIS